MFNITATYGICLDQRYIFHLLREYYGRKQIKKTPDTKLRTIDESDDLAAS